MTTPTTPRFYQQYPDTCLAAFDDEQPFAAETGDLSRKRGTTQYTLERRHINTTLSSSTPASSDFLINARKEIMQEISTRMSDPEVPIDNNITMLSARNSGLLRRLDFSTDEIVTGPDYQPPFDEDCAAARPAWLEWLVTPEVRKLQRSRPHKRNSQYSDAQMDLYCHLRVKGNQVREEWRWLESEGYKPWLVMPAMQECAKEENGRDKYAGEKCESNGYGTAEHDSEGDEGSRNEWEEFLAHFATQHTATHTGGVHSDPGFAESEKRPEDRIYRQPDTRTVADVQFKSLGRLPKRSDFLWRARARMLK